MEPNRTLEYGSLCDFLEPNKTLQTAIEPNAILWKAMEIISSGRLSKVIEHDAIY